MNWLHFAIAFATVAMIHAASPTPPKRLHAPDPVAGRALIDELLAQVPTRNSELYGTLVTRDSDGKRKEIPVRSDIQIGASDWKTIYTTKAVADVPAMKLVVLHTPGKPNQYFLGTGAALQEAASDVQPLKREDTFLPFAGTDFWIADLGLEFFSWPEQRLMGHEMRKSRSCRIVDSIHPNPRPDTYSRVRSWIDVETGGLVLAEAYDSAGKKLKAYSVQKMKKVSGRYEVKELEILNLQSDSRTRLEFNLELETAATPAP